MSKDCPGDYFFISLTIMNAPNSSALGPFLAARDVELHNLRSAHAGLNGWCQRCTEV